MLIFFRNLLRCVRGTLLVDVLIAAVLTGILAVALFVAFGRSSDFGNTSAEYIMANVLAQKQLELLKDSVTNRSADGVICNQAYWNAILPARQAAPPTNSADLYYAKKTVPAQRENSPATFNGSAAQFAISNQACWAYDTTLGRGNGNIDIITTVSWTSSGKTGTSRLRNSALTTQIKYPAT